MEVKHGARSSENELFRSAKEGMVFSFRLLFNVMFKHDVVLTPNLIEVFPL